MEIGKLNQRITILEHSTKIDNIGNHKAQWDEVFSSRPATEGQTIEDSKEVKTETLSLTSTALASGLVKSRSCEQTDKATYDNWYKSVYMPDLTQATSVQSAKSSKTIA